MAPHPSPFEAPPIAPIPGQLVLEEIPVPEAVVLEERRTALYAASAAVHAAARTSHYSNTDHAVLEFAAHYETLGQLLTGQEAQEGVDILCDLLDTGRRMGEGGWVVQSHIVTKTALKAIGDPHILPGLIDLYHQQTDAELWGKTLKLLTARIYDTPAFFLKNVPPLQDFLCQELPNVVARVCEEAVAARRAARTVVEPDTLEPGHQRLLESTAHSIRKLVNTLPAQEAEALLAKLTAQQQTEGSKAVVGYIFSQIARDRFPRSRLLLHWQLDPRELEQVWEKGYGQDLLPDQKTPAPSTITKDEYIAENIRTIYELEYIHPRMAAGLRRTHRIRNFARYDQEALAHMYLNRHRSYAENAVFATALSDHNGAFYRPAIFRKDLYFELVNHGIGVHYIEFENEFELAQLAAIWQAERPTEKFSLRVLSGHGKDNEVEASISRYGTTRHLGITVLRNEAGPGTPIYEIATLDGTDVMNSCDTGKKDDGFAAHAAKAGKRTVLAPLEPAAIIDLTILAREGRITGVHPAYISRYDNGNNEWRTRHSPTQKFNEAGRVSP